MKLKLSRFLGDCKCIKRLSLFLRSVCLPVLSLTRSPAGGHCEWMAAFCDPLFEMCERGVWIIGMVLYCATIIHCYVYVVLYQGHVCIGLI